MVILNRVLVYSILWKSRPALPHGPVNRRASRWTTIRFPHTDRRRRTSHARRCFFVFAVEEDPGFERRMDERRRRVASALGCVSVPVSYTHLTLPTIYSV